MFISNWGLKPLIVASFLVSVAWSAACLNYKENGANRTTSSDSASLTYAIHIDSMAGPVEAIPIGKQLPTTYSERFTYDADDRDIATITISQAKPAGRETILDVDVPVPVNREANVVITVKVNAEKMLHVKASVMETGVIKEFGPFPAE